MKVIKVLVIISVIFLQACNSRKDVEPSNNTPDFVEKVLKDKYPGATEIKTTALEPGKVYRSDFKVNNAPISLVQSKDEILSTARMAGYSLIDSVQNNLKGLAIEGGELSNLRLVEYPDKPDVVLADYLLNGTLYNLEMMSSGLVQLSTRITSYETKSLGNLPEAIQKFINDRNKPNPDYINSLQLDQNGKNYLSGKKELSLDRCNVYLLPDGTKKYLLQVRYYEATTLNLILNENASPFWVASFNRLEEFRSLGGSLTGPTNLSDTDLMYFRNLFNSKTEFKNFTLGDPVGNADASLNAYAGIKSYEFSLHKSGKDGKKSEDWKLGYDADKNPIGAFYQTWINR